MRFIVSLLRHAGVIRAAIAFVIAVVSAVIRDCYLG